MKRLGVLAATGFHALSCIALLVCAPGPAAAEPVKAEASKSDDRTRPTGDLIIVFGPVLAKCPEGRLRRATVSEVSTHPERYRGICVRVAGLWSGRTLYQDLEAYRRVAGRSFDDWEPAARAGHIGLYAPDDVSAMIGRNVIMRAEFIGRITTCENMGAHEVMVMGYCHYVDDSTVMAVADVDYLPYRLDRAVSDVDRLRVGDLAAAPEDWTDRAAVEALVRQWIAAVVHRDRTTLAALGGNEDSNSAWARRALDDIFSNRRLAADASLAKDRPMRLFVSKLHDSLGPDRSSEAWAWEIEGCVCREADCSGRWPISSLDAGNHPSRPFICIHVSQMTGANGDGKPTTWRAEYVTDERRMHEPG